MCALAWEDIDLEKGEIHVSRNLTHKKQFVPPKTNAGFRTITLLKPALKALKEQFKPTGKRQKREITYHHREHGKTEQQHLKFVFVPLTRSKAKVGYYSRRLISNGWKKGIEAAGVRPVTPINPGTHTHAGHWPPEQTRRSLRVRWGMRMPRWFMRFTGSGLVSWIRTR